MVWVVNRHRRRGLEICQTLQESYKTVVNKENSSFFFSNSCLFLKRITVTVQVNVKRQEIPVNNLFKRSRAFGKEDASCFNYEKLWVSSVRDRPLISSKRQMLLGCVTEKQQRPLTAASDSWIWPPSSWWHSWTSACLVGRKRDLSEPAELTHRRPFPTTPLSQKLLLTACHVMRQINLHNNTYKVMFGKTSNFKLLLWWKDNKHNVNNGLHVFIWVGLRC